MSLEDNLLRTGLGTLTEWKDGTVSKRLKQKLEKEWRENPHSLLTVPDAWLTPEQIQQRDLLAEEDEKERLAAAKRMRKT